jgi:hypothetical protein
MEWSILKRRSWQEIEIAWIFSEKRWNKDCEDTME